MRLELTVEDFELESNERTELGWSYGEDEQALEANVRGLKSYRLFATVNNDGDTHVDAGLAAKIFGLRTHIRTACGWIKLRGYRLVFLHLATP